MSARQTASGTRFTAACFYFDKNKTVELQVSSHQQTEDVLKQQNKSKSSYLKEVKEVYALRNATLRIKIRQIPVNFPLKHKTILSDLQLIMKHLCENAKLSQI